MVSTLTQLSSKLMENWAFQTVIMLSIAYAIFSEDIRLGLTSNDKDAVFAVLSTLVLSILFAEFVANCFFTVGYVRIPKFSSKLSFYDNLQLIGKFGTFYFWLDAVSLISIFIEVRQWVLSSPVLPGAFS